MNDITFTYPPDSRPALIIVVRKTTNIYYKKTHRFIRSMFSYPYTHKKIRQTNVGPVPNLPD